MNEGKIFENDFKKSVEKYNYFCYRLKDSAQAFGGTSNLRFSLTNPFDYFMFANRHLFCLELKSTKGTSMSFWREDFEEKGKKQTFMIKKHQIKGLADAIQYSNIVAGLVLNFRDKEKTYFWDIRNFLEFSNNTDKKSFNEDDVIKHNGYLITQTKKIKRYVYEIDVFVNDMTN